MATTIYKTTERVGRRPIFSYPFNSVIMAYDKLILAAQRLRLVPRKLREGVEIQYHHGDTIAVYTAEVEENC